MMVDLKVMAYFKISLSTRNWDSAIKNDPTRNQKQPEGRFVIDCINLRYTTQAVASLACSSPRLSMA
ncbi:hypothetical protein COOFOMLJ_02262 [Aeromonas veronii]